MIFTREIPRPCLPVFPFAAILLLSGIIVVILPTTVMHPGTILMAIAAAIDCWMTPVLVGSTLQAALNSAR
jgi:hypothetical protein